MGLIILKIICLFLAIWLGFVNITQVIWKQTIPFLNMMLMAFGIVGFVIIQFNLWR